MMRDFLRWSVSAVLTLACLGVAAEGVRELPSYAAEAIEDLDLSKTRIHPDGTVEETYEGEDGRVVRLLYEPEGPIQVFGEKLVLPEVVREPFRYGLKIAEEDDLAEAVEELYRRLSSFMVPKEPLDFEVEAEESLTADEVLAADLRALVSAGPLEVLKIHRSTTSYSRDGDYSGQRANYTAEWQEGPGPENLHAEIETLGDLWKAYRTLGEHLGFYEVLGGAPFRVRLTFSGKTVDYRSLALRLAFQGEEQERLYLIDEVAGDGLWGAAGETAEPMTPEDWNKIPDAASPAVPM